MRALILVESPLQLLNAAEAIHALDIRDYKIIIRLSGLIRSDSQLINTLDILNINAENTHKVIIKAEGRTFLDYTKIIFYSWLFSLYRVDSIVIGNADSGFFKRVVKRFTKEQIICLDDGAKTINLINNESEPSHQYFSVFNLGKQSKSVLLINQYQSLKALLATQDLNRSNREIIFLGQKLSELKLLTESKYIDFIRRFAKINETIKIVYISHRGENVDKLNTISNVNNIEVVELDYPIELYGLFNQTIPYKVVSFYSTALYTMREIYGIKAESINASITHPSFKKNIDAIYYFYKNNKIIESSVN